LFSLVFAIAAGLAVHESHARPGGGSKGAARPGGGARPGGNFGGGSHSGGGPARGALDAGQFGKDARQFGKASAGNVGQKFASTAKKSRVGASQNKASQLQANFASRNEPFSPAWYADHPRAWQYTHPHADAWAVATIGSAAAWLGVAAAYPATVYTSEDSTEDDAQSAQDETPSSQSDDAASLAARGAVDVSDDTQFMPLGVFALAPATHTDATAVVQLSVSKDGLLRGSYCDLMTDQAQTVFGAIDKQSQRAAWTVGAGGKVVFATTLASLTQASGPVSLLFANGDNRQWTLARFENKTSDSQ
jgi:hypothetical protein